MREQRKGHEGGVGGSGSTMSLISGSWARLEADSGRFGGAPFAVTFPEVGKDQRT